MEERSKLVHWQQRIGSDRDAGRENQDGRRRVGGFEGLFRLSIPAAVDVAGHYAAVVGTLRAQRLHRSFDARSVLLRAFAIHSCCRGGRGPPTAADGSPDCCGREPPGEYRQYGVSARGVGTDHPDQPNQNSVRPARPSECRGSTLQSKVSTWVIFGQRGTFDRAAHRVAAGIDMSTPEH